MQQNSLKGDNFIAKMQDLAFGTGQIRTLNKEENQNVNMSAGRWVDRS